MWDWTLTLEKFKNFFASSRDLTIHLVINSFDNFWLLISIGLSWWVKHRKSILLCHPICETWLWRLRLIDWLWFRQLYEPWSVSLTRQFSQTGNFFIFKLMNIFGAVLRKDKIPTVVVCFPFSRSEIMFFY